jgi:hypothetical protein
VIEYDIPFALPIRSTTTACNSAAMACAPVQEGAPILTFSALIAAVEDRLTATPKVRLSIDFLINDSSIVWFNMVHFSSLPAHLNVVFLMQSETMSRKYRYSFEPISTVFSAYPMLIWTAVIPYRYKTALQPANKAMA